MTHIIHPIADGVAITTPTGEVSIEQVAQQVAPDGIYAIVDSSAIPADRTFRAAWTYSSTGVGIDLDRAKAIGHDLRRANRNAKFEPYDKVISLQIPGADHDAAEAKRAAIRARYAIIETAIDAATTTDEIKEALQA
jgi:hypothetical protein